MSKQLVVKPEEGEAFIVTVEDSSTIAGLKEQLQVEHGVEAAAIALSYDGVELDDEATVEGAGLPNLATLTIFPRATDDAVHIVDESEMSRSIVVTGIPAAEAAAVEDVEVAILGSFSQYGDIVKLILQSDAADAQLAVVVFAADESATAALTFVGDGLLEGTAVIAASAVELDSEGKDDEGDDSKPAARARRVMAKLLAEGSYMGSKGVAFVKRFDEEHNISLRVKIAAELARMKALELDEKTGASKKVKALDERYRLSERASKAADKAVAAGKRAAATDTGKKVGGFFSRLGKAAAAGVESLARDYEAAKAEVEAREAAKKAAGDAASPEEDDGVAAEVEDDKAGGGGDAVVAPSPEE